MQLKKKTDFLLRSHHQLIRLSGRRPSNGWTDRPPTSPTTSQPSSCQPNSMQVEGIATRPTTTRIRGFSLRKGCVWGSYRVVEAEQHGCPPLSGRPPQPTEHWPPLPRVYSHCKEVAPPRGSGGRHTATLNIPQPTLYRARPQLSNCTETQQKTAERKFTPKKCTKSIVNP